MDEFLTGVIPTTVFVVGAVTLYLLAARQRDIERKKRDKESQHKTDLFMDEIKKKVSEL